MVDGGPAPHLQPYMLQDYDHSAVGGGPPLPSWQPEGPWPMLSMHELSLSMPEPMLSLSMTILVQSSDLGQMICLNSNDII